MPNHDGVVARAEIAYAPGLQLHFAIAADVSFDTHPATTASGGNRWDLAQALEGDTAVVVPTLDPATQWFGASFPTATYAAALSNGDPLLGVFRAGDDGLYLLGVVSPAGGDSRTELAYDPPAQILAFPLAVDTVWQSESNVTGLASGVYTYATESYSGSAALTGTLATPAGEYPVVRAVVGLYRWSAGAFSYGVQQLYVAECVGTVAIVRSHPNDAGPELASAAEIRRRAP